jgi:iron(III) transport system substrate-binding protein
MVKYSILLLFTVSLIFSCKNSSEKTEQVQKQEITLYTHRHYDSDKVIFEKFEQETGIKINVVKAITCRLITYRGCRKTRES